LEHQRAVSRGSRHWSNVVEAVAEWDAALLANSSERRLQARNAAERGRTADRPAGVSANAAQDRAGRERGASPGARAAGQAVEVPWIASEAHTSGWIRPTDGELV